MDDKSFPHISFPSADMEFVQKITPPDFRAKNFTPLISPNFNSFSKKKHKKMSENGEIYTAGKNITLPPAVTEWTNSTSVLYTYMQKTCDVAEKAILAKKNLQKKCVNRDKM